MTEKVYRRCGGLDVHKDTIVARVLPPDGQIGALARQVLGTFRDDLTPLLSKLTSPGPRADEKEKTYLRFLSLVRKQVGCTTGGMCMRALSEFLP